MAKKQQIEELDGKSLAALVNKRWGPNTVRMASDPHFQIERIPTGILSVDWLLDGGFARGRHVEIYGQYSAGKTYLTYRTIASAQELGYDCAFVDAEGTFDPEFAESAGVQLDKLALHEQEHGNQVIDFIETLLRAGDFGVIGLDSIASLLPKQERDADMEAGSYGTAQAKLMSAALRRLTAANQKTVLIYINQLRDAIGSMFGPRSVTSGGRAMSFYASTRLELSKIETLKTKREVIDPKTGDIAEKAVATGHRVLVKVDKEKTGGAKAGATIPFVFDYELEGIDHVEDLIFLSRSQNILKKSGNSWQFEGGQSFNSRSKLYAWLEANEEFQVELEDRLWQSRG